MSFKDHFSAQAQTYAEARPDYPEQLFDFLAAQCVRHELAWDCATGNGQAALSLAKKFERVIATDGSAQQIEQARPAANIEYRQMAAEETSLATGSCDLVTVAQALHWFATAPFFDNVRRCLRPDGVFATWCYGVHRITPSIDVVGEKLYEGILGDYWPAERRLVEGQYHDIAFPFETRVEDGFALSREWDLQQLCAYISSWSALQRYRRQNEVDPLSLVQEELLAAWGGDPQKKRRIEWPLTVIVGRM